jgi:hypothetical protein
LVSPATAFTGLSLSGVTDAPADNGDFSIGYQFTVGASNITVDALGFLDVGRDGLQTAHNVGLWDDTGNLLTSVLVASGTSATLAGFFRYAATIAPITLASGQTYRVAGSFQSGTDRFSSTYSGLTIDPAITIPNQVDIVSPTLAFPTNTNGDIGASSIGADIQFTIAAVPFEFEPTGGLAILGGAWLLHRHLKKKTTKL